MMSTRVLVSLLSFLGWCFSVEAALTNQNKALKIRGSAKLAAHLRKAEDDSKAPKDEDDDDDDDEDDDGKDEPAADSEATKIEQELAENAHKQAKLKEILKGLADKSKSDAEIDGYANKVDNETQSPAMGGMLGKMWKEMRMFEIPSYSKHIEGDLQVLKKEESFMADKLAASQNKAKAAAKAEKAAVVAAKNYGNDECPCVGIDEVEGATMALMKDGSKVAYPADLGARCEDWDLNKHPDCPDEKWCKQQWCYVDPCNCNIPTLPKPSFYIPSGKYQGKPVHYSYATCGGKDSFPESSPKTQKAIEKTCSVKVDEAKWGKDECSCIGISPQPGTTQVSIKNKMVDFPADTGAVCNTWEADNHPECQGEDAPDWCNQAWCYVDPCKCKLATPPKTSSYLPDSNFQGRPVYYSYATCGGTDAYTAGRKEACVNQKSEGKCTALKKCAWTGKECLGKELVSVCQLEDKSAAVGLKAFVALLLPLFGLFC